MGSGRTDAVARCRSRAVRVDDLAEHTVDEMWQIFRRYYDTDDRSGFVRSLAEKSAAFIIEDRTTRRLVGFTSVLVMRLPGYRAVHSGDTIIERDYWGAGRLFGYRMAAFMTKLYLSRPHVPLYWFMISKGYKTYLLMARNVPEFYPTYRRPTPRWAQEVIAEVALRRYGSAFQPETGLIRFPYRRKPLRPWVAPVTDRDRRDPDIAYFLAANQHWLDGDELACLGVIDLRLLLHSWRKFRLKR